METGAGNGHPTQFEGPASWQATREGERSEVHAITQGDVVVAKAAVPAQREDSDDGGENENKKKSAPKTEAELQEKLKTKLEKLSVLYNTTGTMLHVGEHGLYTKDFLTKLESVRLSYYKFDKLPLKLIFKGRQEAGKLVVEHGVMPVLFNIVIFGFESRNYMSAEEKLNVESYKRLTNALESIWNFSDGSDDVTYAIRDHERFLSVLLLKIKDWFPLHMNDALHKAEDYLLSSCMTVIHNTAMRDDNIQRLRQLNTSEVLLPCLQTSNEKNKLTAIASLADIVNEEDADMLAATPETASFLLNRLKRAFRDEKHQFEGWCVTELVRAVRQLGRNDANKRVLVEEGALPLLAEGIQSNLDDEKTGSMEALWALSLHKHNAKSYLDNEELLDMVVAIYQDKSQSETSRRAAEGILWQLRHELEDTDKYKCTAQALSSKSTPAKKTGHVMLSYQWDHQSLVCKIHDLLQKNGVTVWMDVHKMGCSTRQSMAEGVENSFVVLCCMSPKYKDSPPCRQEAEYADDLRKLIVPLKMERDYKPDGWLGLMMAGKLYYDFSDKNSFDRKFLELLKVIRDILGDVIACGDVMSKDVVDSVKLQPDVVEKVMTHPAPASYRSAKCDVDKIRHWSGDDVQDWMNKFGLSGGLLDTLTGEQIAFLHRLRSEAPEFFYNYLKTDFQMTTLPQLLQMTKALDDLPTVK